jgi:hypothetical protein
MYYILGKSTYMGPSIRPHYPDISVNESEIGHYCNLPIPIHKACNVIFILRISIACF